MRRIGKLTCVLAVALLISALAPAPAQLMPGWEKLTGATKNYSGVTDGIMNDRENSYAWSMQIHGDYLYVGTSRDIAGQVLMSYFKPDPWPSFVPVPSDTRGRIYRMKLSTGIWEQFYLADALPRVPGVPFLLGPDLGYRGMKTFTAKNAKPVLYVGGFGPISRLLAIDSTHSAPVPVFQMVAPASTTLSIRALAEHDQQLCWAAEVEGYPAIWCSSNPLKEFQQNPRVQFERITVPANWFPQGAEIFEMISFNGYLYVFFIPHDYEHTGFWCAKVKKSDKTWKWQLIVGDTRKGAKYPAGMGRAENGTGTPFIFNGQVYVGTSSGTMIRILYTGKVDPSALSITEVGPQIFRFDTRDKWERVMPSAKITNPTLVSLSNGFVSPLNVYLWRFAEQNGKLYVGTMDARILLEKFGPMVGLEMPAGIWDPPGFSLYWTKNGTDWYPETWDGFGDQWNYGTRTMVTDPKTGDLYLGTANPFYGCQVWRKKAKLFSFVMPAAQ